MRLCALSEFPRLIVDPHLKSQALQLASLCWTWWGAPRSRSRPVTSQQRLLRPYMQPMLLDTGDTTVLHTEPTATALVLQGNVWRKFHVEGAVGSSGVHGDYGVPMETRSPGPRLPLRRRREAVPPIRTSIVSSVIFEAVNPCVG